jgi:repressor of nif and glnA expression
METITPELMRWRILRALNASRSVPVEETLLLRVLYERQYHPTPESIRGHLNYLREQGLIEFERRAKVWCPSITEAGIAVVQGDRDCPVGLACPGR